MRKIKICRIIDLDLCFLLSNCRQDSSITTISTIEGTGFLVNYLLLTQLLTHLELLEHKLPKLCTEIKLFRIFFKEEQTNSSRRYFAPLFTSCDYACNYTCDYASAYLKIVTLRHLVDAKIEIVREI